MASSTAPSTVQAAAASPVLLIATRGSEVLLPQEPIVCRAASPPPTVPYAALTWQVGWRPSQAPA